MFDELAPIESVAQALLPIGEMNRLRLATTSIVGSALLCIVIVVVVGCTSFATGAADRSALKSATLVEGCPLGVPWSRAELTDLPSSDFLIAFSTTMPSNVEELRRRVRDQSNAYGPNRHRGLGHDGEHGGPRDHGLRLWAIDAELRTQVEDTPTGAKLTITAVDPKRRGDVRERLQQRLHHLKDAGCPN